MAEFDSDEPSSEVLKSCPLDSSFGFNWNADIRDQVQASTSDLEKADLLRRLAGEADLKAAAFESHGQIAMALASRLDSITDKSRIFYPLSPIHCSYIWVRLTDGAARIFTAIPLFYLVLFLG